MERKASADSANEKASAQSSLLITPFAWPHNCSGGASKRLPVSTAQADVKAAPVPLASALDMVAAFSPGPQMRAAVLAEATQASEQAEISHIFTAGRGTDYRLLPRGMCAFALSSCAEARRAV